MQNLTPSCPGTVYLIHISPKLHYVGYAEGDNLDARIAQHRATRWEEYPEPIIMADGRPCKGRKIGDGATLLGVANSRGQAWDIARVWMGSRAEERKLKNYKGSSQFCPCCRGSAAYNVANF